MGTVLNLCPEAIRVCISRGDTTPWTYTIKDKVSGAVINLTGYSFVLTVDPDENPTTSAGNLFQISGTIAAPATGVVQFALTTGQANQTPGIYHYDVQMIDASGSKRTIIKDNFEFVQDITKV